MVQPYEFYNMEHATDPLNFLEMMSETEELNEAITCFLTL
jgi:hypothetical protein